MPSPVNTRPPSPQGAPYAPVSSIHPDNPSAASSSSSAQRPLEVSATRRPAPGPRQVRYLMPDQVSSASIAQLEGMKNSGSPSQNFLVGSLLSHIRNGTLELASNENPSPTVARYGKRIVQPDDRPAILAVNFAVGHDGKLNVRDTALLDVLSRSKVAKVTCPRSDRVQGGPEGTSASAPDDSRERPILVREEIDLTSDLPAPKTSTLGKRPLSVRSGSDSPPAGAADKRLNQCRTTEKQADEPEGISGPADDQGPQDVQPTATKDRIDPHEYIRNMKVAAALHNRGWPIEEVASFKCSAMHLKVIRETHSDEPALLEQLNAHVEMRAQLGDVLDGALFLNCPLAYRMQKSIDQFSAPSGKTVKSWARTYAADPLVTSSGTPNINIEAALSRFRELPRLEAWRTACVPVAKKLLEAKFPEDALRALTWEALRAANLVDDTCFRSFRSKALNLHWYKQPSDQVFPRVPEDKTLHAYLHELCQSPAKAGPEDAGRASPETGSQDVSRQG